MKIAITGGKGGTGKSTVAVNLAAAFVKLGKTVTLIDCDVDCPNDHLLLGASLKKKQEVHSFLPKIDESKCQKCGACTKACAENALFMIPGKVPQVSEKICSGCEACKLACPHGAISESKKLLGWTYKTEKNNIKLVTGELKTGEPLSLGVVLAAKDRGLELGKNSNFTIVDTAAGTHCDVVRALHGSEKTFVVTEPTPFGLHDLKAIEDVLNKIGLKYDVILNRSDIANGSKPKSILEIPYSEKMLECYVTGIPIVQKYPEHKISKSFLKLAEGLE